MSSYILGNFCGRVGEKMERDYFWERDIGISRKISPLDASSRRHFQFTLEEDKYFFMHLKLSFGTNAFPDIFWKVYQKIRIF
jgi:hypothetical protein